VSERAEKLVPYSIYEKYRQEKGVTDYAVAKATNITTAALTMWKQGVYAPKEDKLIEIANYLGVPFASLYAVNVKPDKRKKE